MSVTGGVKDTSTGKSSWPRWARDNVVASLALVVRPPRTGHDATPAWRSAARLTTAALAALALTAITMIVLDGRAVGAAAQLPRWVIDTFNEITDFGRSGWLLWPLGGALALIALVASPSLPRISRLVLVTLSVRLAFIFAAIAVPGVFVTVVKRLIGRARPLAEAQFDVFLYVPFSWHSKFSAMPSGHATTAFAALIAFGVVWPRLRPVLWLYAIVIALSRVVVSAHHPSDVIVAAFIGVVGALLVRDWYAARRLGFVLEPDGSVRALPGPSFARIKRVARQVFAA
jgi:undecaprenyl-diphosphatase